MQRNTPVYRANGIMQPAYLNGRRREVLIAALAGGPSKA